MGRGYFRTMPLPARKSCVNGLRLPSQRPSRSCREGTRQIKRVYCHETEYTVCEIVGLCMAPLVTCPRLSAHGCCALTQHVSCASARYERFRLLPWLKLRTGRGPRWAKDHLAWCYLGRAWGGVVGAALWESEGRRR